MTIKQMAEVAGISSETVRAKAKEMYPDRFMKGRKTIFTQAEAVPIMSELRKKGFIQPTENLQLPTENREVAQLGAMVANLAVMMESTIKMMQNQQNQIAVILSNQKPHLSIESKQAPVLSPRDELRKIVSKAANESRDYSGAWKTLYTEIYYRLHINAQERAKNAKTSAIDILESEGMIENAVLIAREIFK